MTAPTVTPCSQCGVYHSRSIACFVVGQTARATVTPEVTAETLTKLQVKQFVRDSGGFSALTYEQDLDCQRLLGIETDSIESEARIRVAAAINARKSGR